MPSKKKTRSKLLSKLYTEDFLGMSQVLHVII